MQFTYDHLIASDKVAVSQAEEYSFVSDDMRQWLDHVAMGHFYIETAGVQMFGITLIIPPSRKTTADILDEVGILVRVFTDETPLVMAGQEGAIYNDPIIGSASSSVQKLIYRKLKNYE